MISLLINAFIADVICLDASVIVPHSGFTDFKFEEIQSGVFATSYEVAVKEENRTFTAVMVFGEFLDFS